MWGQSRDLNAEAFTGRQDSWSGKFMIVDGIGADLSVQRHRCGTVVWGPWHECQCVGGNISEASGKHAGTCIQWVCSYKVVNTILWYILYVDVHLELLLDLWLAMELLLLLYCWRNLGWRRGGLIRWLLSDLGSGSWPSPWVCPVFFFHLHKRISICCKYGDA